MSCKFSFLNGDSRGAVSPLRMRLLIALVLTILLALVPITATAATGCVYEAGASLVEISVDAGERWTVAVAAGGEIVLESDPTVLDCQAATIGNTQAIRVHGPLGDETWFGVRHDGEGGRFPSSIAFDIDLGIDPSVSRPSSAVDTLAITGRQGADASSSAWDSETRLWALGMNGTSSVVRGATMLHLSLLGGADVHSGLVNQVDGGAGNDEIEIPDEGWGTLVVGGPGNDVLRASSAQIYAGTGDDTIIGSGIGVDAGMGDDWIEGSDFNVDEGTRPNGADTIIGADLDDFVSYVDRTNGVNVSLDNKANDGEPGEGDNIIDVPYINTGSGDDVVIGSDADEVFSTGLGRDTGFGKGGDDGFYDGQGGDTIYGGSGNDWFELISGAGVFYGGAGHDYFFGADGSYPSDPSLDVSDEVYGGEGNDHIYTFCGDDLITGGSGNDRIHAGTRAGLIGVCGDEDRARGGAGADHLQGGQGDDRLVGDEDLDTANGGTGIDACDAESEVACEVEP